MAGEHSRARTSGDAQVNVEFFVEPFTEGQPGEHVNAAITAFEALGLSVDVGPFGSMTSGDIASTTTGIADMVTAAIAAGAERIQLQITITR